MRRRDFFGLFGGAAAWPLGARAQERVRRVGVLTGGSENDPDTQARLAGFRQGLEALGWTMGRNLNVEYRYAGGQIDPIPALAKELIASQPDAILSQGTPITAAFRRGTTTIPVVFVTVSDPVGSGFITNLARPGGNVTGFLMYESGIVGKWLGMLKEVAPPITRVALLGSRSSASFDYFVRAASAAAPSFGLDLMPSGVENAADIERAIESLARTPNGGLLLPPDNTIQEHRNVVIALAGKHRLPAVYALRSMVASGGLMSYGTPVITMFRSAASYIDRILRGEKPADLPVQAPTKFETVINIKTAKALGLVIPPGLLVAADEVIE